MSDRAAALRLLAAQGRLTTSRPAILLAAARARRGLPVFTLWPDASSPMICADVGYPPAAEWLRATIVPTLRRLPDPAAWMALRAGAALMPTEPGVAARAARQALGVERPRVVMHRHSGHVASKAICFVFAEGDDEPRAVIKAMGDPRFTGRLRSEARLLDALRLRLAHAPAVADALPRAPLPAGELDGEEVLVETLDRVALATGRSTRRPALAWLRGFQAATAEPPRVWTAGEADAAAAEVHATCTLVAALPAAEIAGRAHRLLAELVGTPVERCAVHGDFWRGNVAAAGDHLRVMDWEWATLSGTPLFDLWIYELAELRWQLVRAEARADPGLRASLARVRAELAARGVDPRWALAMLAPVLAEFSSRIRRRIGAHDPMEGPSTALLEAAGRLLAAAD